jgi:flagellar biosynthesis regulator FlbT
MKPETRLRQICTRLESPTLQDSQYIIKGKSYLSNDTKSDDYIIDVNKKQQTQDVIITPPQNLTSVDGYSFDKALKIEIELKHTQMERDALKEKFEDLQTELEECNNRLSEYEEEEENKLSEESAPNWQTFISEALATVTPIIDKHMELKERAILLQENKIIQQETPKETATPNNKFNKELVQNINDEIINQIDAEQNEELKQKLINCYEQSENLEDLISSINVINPELMQNVSNTVNNRV